MENGVCSDPSDSDPGDGSDEDSEDDEKSPQKGAKKEIQYQHNLSQTETDKQPSSFLV